MTETDIGCLRDTLTRVEEHLREIDKKLDRNDDDHRLVLRRLDEHAGAEKFAKWVLGLLAGVIGTTAAAAISSYFGLAFPHAPTGHP
jgi:hypothetical protein